MGPSPAILCELALGPVVAELQSHEKIPFSNHKCWIVSNRFSDSAMSRSALAEYAEAVHAAGSIHRQGPDVRTCPCELKWRNPWKNREGVGTLSEGVCG